MKKDFKIFNDIDIDFSEYERIPLTTSEKKSVKKSILKSKSTKYKYILAALLMITVGSILLSSTNSAIANLKSRGDNINEYFKDDYGQEVNLDKYTTNINKVIYDKGISIQVDSATLDTDKVIVKTNIDYSNFDINKFKKHISNPLLSLEGYIGINGKKLKYPPSYRVENISPNVDNYIFTFGVGDLDLDLDSDINVSLDYYIKLSENYPIPDDNNAPLPELVPDVIVNGSWRCDFSINGKEFKSDSKEGSFSKDLIEHNDMTFKINKVILSPISLKVNYTIPSGEYGMLSDLVAIDENGTICSYCSTFGTSPDEKTGLVEFKSTFTGNKITLVPKINNELDKSQAIDITF